MKKLLVALAVGVAVFAAAYASAASLGGLNSDDLGSDDDVVASCDTAGGIVVTYDTLYSATSAAYVVDKVNVNGVDAACAGQTIKATLSGGTTPSNASLAEVSATAVAGSNAITVGATVIAEQVQGVHVVISNPHP